MHCSRCGFQNEQGAAFCVKCGAPAVQTGHVSSMPIHESPSGLAAENAQVPKKKRLGLIVGLTVGGIVLVGVAAALVLLLGSAQLDGVWYCEERSWVLQFEERALTEYSLAGTDAVQYSFEGGKGEADLRHGDASFSVLGDRLMLTDKASGDRCLFERQEPGFDIEDAVLHGLEGLWSNKELGEVVELRDGALLAYTGAQELTGNYEFDVRHGRGTLRFEGGEYEFSADLSALSIEAIGTYERAENGLDVAAFLSEFGNPLLTTWYDTAGAYGSITFNADDTFAIEVYGKTFEGTYMFDKQSGIGSATLDLTGEAEEFTYADGVLTLEGVTYTQQYVDQPTADDVFNAVTGEWYDPQLPEEVVIFYEDGTVGVSGGDMFYTGTYTFDPFDQSGVITLTNEEQEERYEFSLFDGTMDLSGYSYIRRAQQTQVGTVLGTWYDTAGVQGTLYFDKDGFVLMDSHGVMYTGTYTFNAASASGSMTLDYIDGTQTWSLELRDEMLNTGDAVYTLEMVEQSAE